MEKTPLLSVSPEPVTLWYEGPTFLVAEKPPGLAVHPDSLEGPDSLVNRLLQANRWLAEMETSHTPGVVHTLEQEDRGLVLVAKSDEMAETLRAQYRAGRLTFSYRVRLPDSVSPRQRDDVQILDHQTADNWALFDIDSAVGDTGVLRSEWLGGAEDAFFVLYRMRIQTPAKTLEVGLADRVWLPSIDLYTVPP